MRNFDFYEFVGVLIPGVLFLYGASLAYPALIPIMTHHQLSIGDMSLFVIIAYAVGHLIQSVGNMIEAVWWKPWGGMPTNWVCSGHQKLIAKAQREKLLDQLRLIVHLDLKDFPASHSEWYSITRQIYAAVKSAGRADRVDTFNGNYGMFRGVSAAILLIVMLSFLDGNFVHWGFRQWSALVAALVTTGLSIYRMHRFGRSYARELFVQFLTLPAIPQGDKK